MYNNSNLSSVLVTGIEVAKTFGMYFVENKHVNPGFHRTDILNLGLTQKIPTPKWVPIASIFLCYYLSPKNSHTRIIHYKYKFHLVYM